MGTASPLIVGGCRLFALRPDAMTPDSDAADLQALGLELVLALALLAVVAVALTFVLLRAASKTMPAMVTISLSVLTLVAIVGFMLTGAETLGTLAGAGMGALAGALTNLFTPDVEQPPDKDEGSR